VQLDDLKKYHARLRNQADSRSSEIDATAKRLSHFQAGLQTTTKNIDSLIDVISSELSRPVADDVPSIQRSQQQFSVRCIHYG
jgi:hypothetical protein